MVWVDPYLETITLTINSWWFTINSRQTSSSTHENRGFESHQLTGEGSWVWFSWLMTGRTATNNQPLGFDLAISNRDSPVSESYGEQRADSAAALPIFHPALRPRLGRPGVAVEPRVTDRCAPTGKHSRDSPFFQHLWRSNICQNSKLGQSQIAFWDCHFSISQRTVWVQLRAWHSRIAFVANSKWCEQMTQGCIWLPASICN